MGHYHVIDNFTFELKNIEINLEKNGYRLPTEAEWEYACRAGTSTKYYWGNNDDDITIKKYEWYNKKVDDNMSIVGNFLPNPFGLYDMLGNVSEWCHDGARSYSKKTLVDPIVPHNASNSVTRGGSWTAEKQQLSSYFRYISDYHTIDHDKGFRCILKR